MDLKGLEKFSDNALNRLDTAADEHFNGQREDKSAMVQSSMSNATARQITANLNIRKTRVREALAIA